MRGCFSLIRISSSGPKNVKVLKLLRENFTVLIILLNLNPEYTEWLKEKKRNNVNNGHFHVIHKLRPFSFFLTEMKIKASVYFILVSVSRC